MVRSPCHLVAHCESTAGHVRSVLGQDAKRIDMEAIVSHRREVLDRSQVDAAAPYEWLSGVYGRSTGLLIVADTRGSTAPRAWSVIINFWRATHTTFILGC